jgi:hypothetical protein
LVGLYMGYQRWTGLQRADHARIESDSNNERT